MIQTVKQAIEQRAEATSFYSSSFLISLVFRLNLGMEVALLYPDHNRYFLPPLREYLF